MTMFQRIGRTILLVVFGGLGLIPLVLSFAAYTKMHDATVIRNGFAHDYLMLTVVTGAVGMFFASVTVFLILRPPRPKPAPPAEHF